MKVFIDGSAGTTGLCIHDRISKYENAELITIPEEYRKDPNARREALNSADIAFLCLPDDAAREAVSLIENDRVTVIDTSTAHRTAPDWAYGFPELSDSFKEKMLKSKRIAVPGCHASGFVALVYPLIEAGILDSNADITCFSVTGYSGGGKKMIADYESTDRDFLLGAPRQYALTQNHKHLKEMIAVCGLKKAPIFSPVVADFYSGMTVTVPLFASNISKTAEDIKKVYKEKYTGPIVRYDDTLCNDGFVSSHIMHGTDAMKITVGGNSDRILLIASFDNLGKGASGAAVECMNHIIGENITKGLIL